MSIQVEFQTGLVLVDGVVKFKVRRNFYLYDLKSLNNRYLECGLLKTEVEDAVKRQLDSGMAAVETV